MLYVPFSNTLIQKQISVQPFHQQKSQKKNQLLGLNHLIDKTSYKLEFSETVIFICVLFQFDV